MMTRAKTVTRGQERAMIATMMARMPCHISEVELDLNDLNMGGFPFRLAGILPAGRAASCARPAPLGVSVPAEAVARIAASAHQPRGLTVCRHGHLRPCRTSAARHAAGQVLRRGRIRLANPS